MKSEGLAGLSDKGFSLARLRWNVVINKDTLSIYKHLKFTTTILLPFFNVVIINHGPVFHKKDSKIASSTVGDKPVLARILLKYFTLCITGVQYVFFYVLYGF